MRDTVTGNRDSFCRRVTVPKQSCDAEFTTSPGGSGNIRELNFHAITPKDSNTIIMWTFGKDTLYGRNVKYTFPETGKFPVCMHVKKPRCSAKKCTDVSITDSSSGLPYSGRKHASILSFYPNPVSQSGTLVVQSAKSREVTIEIYSVTGKQMLSRRENISSGMNAITIETGALSQGIYILRITGQGEYREMISIAKLK